MGYNRINKLKKYRLVVELTKKHYIPGITTYSGIWREYVNPVYPMSYASYLKIINMPNLEGQLRDAIEQREEQRRQLNIFD